MRNMDRRVVLGGVAWAFALALLSACGGGGGGKQGGVNVAPQTCSALSTPNYRTTMQDFNDAGTWSGFPLTVWIETQVPSERNQIIAGLAQWASGLQSIVNTIPVDFAIVGDPASADITIEMVTQAEIEAETSVANVAGLAIVTSQGDRIVEVRVLVLDTLGDAIQAVSAHEIGHALGLGHSPTATDLMYFQYDGTNGLATRSDLNTVLALYDCTFGVRSKSEPTGPRRTTVYTCGHEHVH